MIEETITQVVLWLKLFVQTVGALLIGFGALATLVRFLRMLGHPSIRLQKHATLTRAFPLTGLEFQLAADILGTAVAPSWDTDRKTRRDRCDPHGSQLLPRT